MTGQSKARKSIDIKNSMISSNMDTATIVKMIITHTTIENKIHLVYFIHILTDKLSINITTLRIFIIDRLTTPNTNKEVTAISFHIRDVTAMPLLFYLIIL